MDHFTPTELLFEIPVYRFSHDEYHRRLSERINKAADSHGARGAAGETPPDARAREWAAEHERRRFGRPYWYNEMIGVIRLYQDGASIKGQFWGQPQRAFRWNFRHYQYEHQERVIEYRSGAVPRSSLEIYEDLLGSLMGLTDRGGPLQRRHVDLYAFRRVGPHVDWQKVLSWRAS